MIARGISGSGAGFDAPSAGKVGGRFTGRADEVPPHRLRELALQAAEARRKRQAVMPTGPRTTGGVQCVALHLTWALAGEPPWLAQCRCRSVLSCDPFILKMPVSTLAQVVTCRCATCRHGRQLRQPQSAGKQH